MPTITDLKHLARPFGERIETLKREHVLRAGFWYPYGSLSNLDALEKLLGADFDLSSLAGDGHIADIGAADGDVAFFLESAGFKTAIIDHAPTNANHLEGARLLRQLLPSQTEIYDVDLDVEFSMPVDAELALFLGILYHLKNPFYVLEGLARSTKFCLVSTRIARFTPDYKLDLKDYPLSYLVHATETNNDPKNYWIFSEAGLRRLFERTGWRVERFVTIGDTERSNPASAANDERAFCLLQSTWAPPSLRAAPNPVPAGAGLGLTTVEWDTADGYAGEVYVSFDGEPEALFGQGAVGSIAAPFIQADHTYVFNLYRGTNRELLLATTTVTRA